jgi:hypothetical protein
MTDRQNIEEPIGDDSYAEEAFNYEIGEQTRIELTEAEAEFLKVLDDEMGQKKEDFRKQKN